MNIKKLASSIVIIVVAVMAGLGIQYVLADWSPAPGTPPACPSGSPGCDAPINVSGSPQAKVGYLSLGTSTLPTIAAYVEGNLFATSIGTNMFTYSDGNQHAGYVLQSSNGNGLAKWVSTSTLGIGGGTAGVTRIVAGNNITITSTGPNGTGIVTISASSGSSSTGTGGSSGTTVVGGYTIANPAGYGAYSNVWGYG
ncbi:MAG: hypothetical protein KGJ35_03145 [Patescibacteria group bacterium]|nr:hypothetical protein [Patescibacteria group bacterium]